MGDRLEGQRRQVTVLFADMVGYTTISERLGEEATYGLMQAVLEPISRLVHEQGGKVQTFTGDGVMALFGALAGTEDVPLQACRAALSIQEEIGRIGDEIESAHGARPILRIGINSGPVVIGKVGTGPDVEFTPLGDTVNVAARLQAGAERGTILISEATWKLVHGRVEAPFADERQLKGKAQAQRVYRLESLNPGTTRFDVAADRGLTNLVERELELEALWQCWELARAGVVHFVNIVGEAGIGKSRLMHEFRQRLPSDNVFVLEGDCHAGGVTSPFLPFIEVVRTSFQILAEHEGTVIEERLRSGLEVLGLDVEETLPYLLALLGQETGNPTFAAQGADLIGMRTRRILLDLLWQRCRMTPVVMFVEDLHWIDSASRELLQQVVEADQRLPLLVVCAYRPQYDPPWSSLDNATEVALGPLTGGGTEKLLAERLDTTDLASELLRLVMEKSEGNPLFVEEIANYLQEKRQDAAGLPATIDDVVLPANLQNLVMDRFDRLDEDARSLLQAAAVIGRKFSSSLVQGVVQLNSGISDQLAELERQELVFPIQDPYADYAFKHALVRDAIYDTLLTQQKGELHAEVGDALELAYAGRLEEIVEVLAHHFELTDRRDQAIRYLTMAGRKSLQLFSLEEADRRFARAVELIESGGQIEGGDVNIAVILAGWSETLYWRSEFVRTVEVVLPRLSAIMDVGSIPQASVALQWLGYAYTQMGRGEEADRYIQQALAIAEECSDEEAVALSCLGLMQLHNMRPWDTPAEYVSQLANRAIATAQKHGNLFLWYGAKVNHAVHDGMRGNFDAARRKSLELVELGRREGYGGAIAFGLWGISYVQVMSERFEEAIQTADDGAKAAVGANDRLTCLSAKGTAMVLAGHVSPGLELLRDVRRQITEIGYLALLTVTEVPIGVAMVLDGDIAAGVRWLEAAITTMSRSGNAYGAAFGHLALGQIYAEITAGNEKPPLSVVFKNLIFLLRTIPFGKAKALHHFEAAIRISRNSALQGIEAQALMHIGLLYKAKRKLPDARRHLEEAQAVAATLEWQFINDKIAAELTAIE